MNGGAASRASKRDAAKTRDIRARKFFSSLLRHGRWRGSRCTAPRCIRTRPHLEGQRSSVSDITVLKPRLVQRFAVQFRGLYVLVHSRDVLGGDREHLPIAESDLRFPENRAADVIHRTAGTNRKEPHGAHDVPGGHPASILVADDPRRTGIIPDCHDVPHPALGLPGLTGIVVQVWNVEGWLVPRCVVSD